METNRLIGSRMTEEMVAETWHHVAGNHRHDRDAWAWLESDVMKGRWCIPASSVAVGKGGIFFELEEDALMFKLRWSP